MDMEPRDTSYMSGTPFIGANLRMKAAPGISRGALIAWDFSAARPAWTVAEDFPVEGGVLATGGGVVFYGTLDGEFKAVDARDGHLLWQFHASSGIIGQPITFRLADGHQMSPSQPEPAVRRGGWPRTASTCVMRPRRMAMPTLCAT